MKQMMISVEFSRSLSPRAPQEAAQTPFDAGSARPIDVTNAIIVQLDRRPNGHATDPAGGAGATVHRATGETIPASGVIAKRGITAIRIAGRRREVGRSDRDRTRGR